MHVPATPFTSHATGGAPLLDVLLLEELLDEEPPLEDELLDALPLLLEELPLDVLPLEDELLDALLDELLLDELLLAGVPLPFAKATRSARLPLK